MRTQSLPKQTWSLQHHAVTTPYYSLAGQSDTSTLLTNPGLPCDQRTLPGSTQCPSIGIRCSVLRRVLLASCRDNSHVSLGRLAKNQVPWQPKLSRWAKTRNEHSPTESALAPSLPSEFTSKIRGPRVKTEASTVFCHVATGPRNPVDVSHRPRPRPKSIFEGGMSC